MELKEFITETISAITDATIELQKKYDATDVLIYPPSDGPGSKTYQEASAAHTYRHVKDVEFDVALTVGTATEGGGKAGIKVMSLDIGAGGGVAKSSEQISRVHFSIPLALTHKEAENKNLEAERKRQARFNQGLY
jgi:hypothetical protein